MTCKRVPRVLPRPVPSDVYHPRSRWLLSISVVGRGYPADQTIPGNNGLRSTRLMPGTRAAPHGCRGPTVAHGWPRRPLRPRFESPDLIIPGIHRSGSAIGASRVSFLLGPRRGTSGPYIALPPAGFRPGNSKFKGDVGVFLRPAKKA